MLRRMMIYAVACAAMVLTGVSLAGAAEEANPAEEFKKLDVNSNGILSVEEYVGDKQGAERQQAIAKFRELDTNEDNGLTLAEFSAQYEEKED